MKYLEIPGLVVLLLIALFALLVGQGKEPIHLWLWAGLLEALGFESEVVVPERPPTVPESAVWAGGVDGGAWFECSIDQNRDANWCTIWDDQSGSVWARTHFVLREEGRPVQVDEVSFSSFNGLWIRLDDGRILEPLKFHREGRRDFEPAPIDPVDR